ncbi:MAG: ATP-binding protein [Desulfobacterales bacterium]
MKKTQWIVITGAPCSGKSSVISSLEHKGFRVVHEVARAYIGDLLKSGKTIEEIKSDELFFEREILFRKIKIEAGLPENETIFMDRGIPDSIGYFKSANLDIAEPLEKSRQVRYRKVFHFQPLWFEKDIVRIENEQMIRKLDTLLRQSYEMLAYSIVHVPVLPVEKRVDFILKNLH